MLVLLIPTAASLLLGGLRLHDSWEQAQAATHAESLARALPDTYTLALLLQQERDAYGASSAKQLAKVRAMTDGEIATWRPQADAIDTSQDPTLGQALDSVQTSLHGLPALRSKAQDVATRSEATGDYTQIINSLLALSDHLPTLGDPTLVKRVDSLSNIGPAAQSLQQARQQVTVMLSTNHTDTPSVVALAATSSKWEQSASAFVAGASPEAQRQFAKLSGKIEGPISTTISGLLAGQSPAGTEMTATAWNRDVATYFAAAIPAIRTAAADLDAEVNAKKDEARRGALGNGALILVVLLLVVVEVILAARSIVRPLARLRDAALDVADRALPDRVRELEESDEPSIQTAVRPLGIGNRDEIAEVAAAFDAVHAQAVGLASEQAQMRASVNKMVANLSRRSHGLVERQLRLIDELERDEQDPDSLANLFRLDHLATRMRRNDDSLMVLAGGGGGQQSRGDVRVLDVLRAASSEVEQYDRVQIDAPAELLFRGSVAGDLVHLLAELIENATNFSPPKSPVTVRVSNPTSLGMIIEVADMGLGMSATELVAANRKLESASRLDADVARMMGLVVVARLAARHALSVELRPNVPRGTVARIVVPSDVLASGGAAPAAFSPLATSPAVPPAPAPASLAPGSLAVASPAPARPAVATDPLSDPLTGPLQVAGIAVAAPAAPMPSAASATQGQNATASLPRRTPPAAPAAAAQPFPAAGSLAARGTSPYDAPAAPAAEQGSWFSPTTDQEAPLNNVRSPEQGAPGDPARVSPPTVTTPIRRPLVPYSRTSGASADPAGPAPSTPSDNADASPIFEALRSEWFVRRLPGERSQQPSWHSPGDVGWRRAAELREAEAAQSATTTSGLPVRVPGRNLIAGSADAAPQGTSTPTRDPRRTSGLSGFQQGVTRARTMHRLDESSHPTEEATQ